jgi:hypothetical protein
LQATDRLEADFHRFIHGKWGTIEDSYNDALKNWLDNHKKATADQLFRFVGALREEWIRLYDVYIVG